MTKHGIGEEITIFIVYGIIFLLDVFISGLGVVNYNIAPKFFTNLNVKVLVVATTSEVQYT